MSRSAVLTKATTGLKSFLSVKNLPSEEFTIPECKVSYSSVDPKNTLVLVTGAAGMLGSHICRELLLKGYGVRGIVRDGKQKVRAKKMRKSALFPQEGTLKYFEADLRKSGALDEAMTGVDFVIHTAVPSSWNNAQELVSEVTDSMNNVLATAQACKVKRVVLTSSLMACFDSPKPKTYSSSDWNTESSLKINPMAFAKTTQEKLAWEYVKANPEMDLVSILPGTMIGPLLPPRPTSNPLFGVMTLEYPVVLDFWWSLVDGREVARAHIAAFENSKAHGRYLLAPAESLSMDQVVTIIATEFPLYKLPSDSSGKASKVGGVSVQLMSYTKSGQAGQDIRNALGRKITVETKRALEDLAFDPQSDLKPSIKDSINSYIYWGFIPDQRESAVVIADMGGDRALLELAAWLAGPDGPEVKDRKPLMGKSEASCWVGEEAVQCLLEKKKENFKGRSKAERMLNVMFEKGLFVEATGKKKCDLGNSWYRWEKVVQDAVPNKKQ